MSKIIIAAACLALILSLCGCPYSGEDPDYKLTMYISLGPGSVYPAEYPGNETQDLVTNYWGKTVVFEVVGLDTINDEINILQTDQFNWTGGDQETGTQYAEAIIDLSDNTMYLAGRYKFSMFIDFDGNETISSGDIVFESYRILADMDDDPYTGSIEVNQTEYPTAVQYNTPDFSLTITDPLADDFGLPWIVTDIHEGTMTVYPAD